MDLTTHLAFGLAIGLAFYGKPEAALIIGFGALLPDLDREYWFVRRKLYRDEQPHRARFHNVFIMGLAYIVSPFLALGIFLHALLDSLTTVKDRGVELFWPLTRLVKSGLKSGDRSISVDHPADEHIFYWQEDVEGFLEDADPDAWKPGDKPVPWRRIYGFSLNSRILDRWFLLGSIGVIITWLIVPSFNHAKDFYIYLSNDSFFWLVGFVGLILIYVSGELDRKFRAPAEIKISLSKTFSSNKYPLIVMFGVGVTFLGYWIYLNVGGVLSSLMASFGNMTSFIVGTMLIAVAGIISILLDKRKDGTGII